MKRTFLFLAALAAGVGCASVQKHEIIVRFEDLRQDLFLMELAVENKQWATFDWNTMTVTISRAFDAPAAGRGGAPDVDLRDIRPSEKMNEIQVRRQTRVDTFAALRRAGKVGLGRDGLVYPVPNGPALTEEEKVLVAAENADRRALFEEIARLKREKGDDISAETIGRVFAEARRRLLKPGEWYQDDDGKWQQVKEENR